MIQGTTTIESNTISVDDKNLELAAVANVTFTAVCVAVAIDLGITPTAGIIPGMRLNSVTGGIDLGANCEIVSLNGNSTTLSTSVTGSGTATIDGTGPSDTVANGGGLILKETQTRLSSMTTLEPISIGHSLRTWRLHSVRSLLSVTS